MSHPPNHSVEMRLLIACCQQLLGPNDPEDFLALFSQAFDERLFVSLCEEHRLFLVVFHTLILPFKTRLPQPFVAQLSKRATQIKVKQLAIEQVLIEIHEAFNAHHIEHAFLKGPPLNQLLFANKMLRYSNDLDVLILPKDITKANDILQRFGFKPRISIKAMQWLSRFRYLSERKDVIYDRLNTPFTIELHWKTHEIELLYMQPNSWLNQRLFCLFKQQRIPVLSHEHHCLYLCCHAIKHKWKRLRWLFDIVLFIQRYQLDCNQLLALAHSYQLANVMLETFMIIKQVFCIDYISQLRDAPKPIKLSQIECALAYRCHPPSTNWSNLKKLHRLYYLNQFCTSYRYHLRYWWPVCFRIIINGPRALWRAIKAWFALRLIPR